MVTLAQTNWDSKLLVVKWEADDMQKQNGFLSNPEYIRL